MIRGPVVVLFAALTSLRPVPGQTIHIVDPVGSGTFRTITDAVNASMHGDTILVRRGTYGPPDDALTVSKGISILAEPGAQTSGAVPRVIVSALPADRRFVVDGLGLSGNGGSGVWAMGNSGEVVFANLTMSRPTCGSVQVFLSDSRQVALRNTSSMGMYAVRVASFICEQCSFSACSEFAGYAAITTEDSKATLVNCTASGGSGVYVGGPGIAMRGGDLVLAGSTVLAAGKSTFNMPIAAVAAQGGNGTVDPGVRLIPQGGAPDISGATSVRRQPVPFCTLSALTARAHATLAVNAPPGSPFCVFLAPAAAARPTPFGTLWFDPTAAPMACGVIGSFGRTSFGFTVPAETWPGSVWVAQAGVLASASPAASEPGLAVARW